jgi:hypothetical protein
MKAHIVKEIGPIFKNPLSVLLVMENNYEKPF